jgi:hypothetical protein
MFCANYFTLICTNHIWVLGLTYWILYPALGIVVLYALQLTSENQTCQEFRSRECVLKSNGWFLSHGSRTRLEMRKHILGVIHEPPPNISIELSSKSNLLSFTLVRSRSSSASKVRNPFKKRKISDKSCETAFSGNAINAYNSLPF